jgi:hypothetical protein
LIRKAVFSLIVALSLTGCATTSGGRGDIDEVHLIGLPVTFNLDARPGPDGFAVRVFVTKGGSAKGAQVTSGALEVLIFDGVTGRDELAVKQPLQVWKFSVQQLAALREQSSLGTGYRFALRWQNSPTKNYITVAARYLPPKGEPIIYSSPSTITTAIK